LLSELGRISDGFRDVELEAYFNGYPAVQLVVYQVGKQTPNQVSKAVQGYVDELRRRLPPGIGVAALNDRSELYRDRVKLLLKNAATGLVLVLLVLGLFLELRLAFWVTMGIPVSFLGSFLLIPAMGVSINMVSLFAFIITLGIVVDDAIVVGENIYKCRQHGMPLLQAAVIGSQQVKVPVSFAVLTNIAAFVPMFFIPGVMGKFFWVIPAIVVAVFTISWVESLWVLPAHLGHSRPSRAGVLERGIAAFQERFGRGLAHLIENYYVPLCRQGVRRRYVTLSGALALLILTVGVFAGGRIDFTFMPKVDADQVSVKAQLPYGVPLSNTRQTAERLERGAREALRALGGEQALRGILTLIGGKAADFGPGPQTADSGGSHICSLVVYLVPSDDREFDAFHFAQAWRKAVGEIPGLESLSFVYSTGPSAGGEIEIEVSHDDIDTLHAAAEELGKELARFKGIKDVDDGFALGKPQLNFNITPLARAMGVTALELGRQVRGSFYGSRAMRQQRGRDEIWIMARLPEEERRSEQYLHTLMIRTPAGGEIPLQEAVRMERGRAYTEIRRADGRRAVSVTADVIKGEANAGKVLAEVKREILPRLARRYPGVRFAFEGRQRDQREGLSALAVGFSVALLAIFSMLAVPLRSYLQPCIIMSAIPFGFVGAVVGHLLMGYDLSLVSVMGLIALAGVAVNDSLVFVYFTNELRGKGIPLEEAVVQAGAGRFRPIMLTSLTTFLGLAPMIFETSVQARFLIPMALSLGFGVMFSTIITLLLVPALYLIIEDLKEIFGFGMKKRTGEAASVVRDA